MSVGLSPWGATARLSWQDCPSDLPPFPATQAVGQGPERRVKWRMSQRSRNAGWQHASPQGWPVLGPGVSPSLYWVLPAGLHQAPTLCSRGASVFPLTLVMVSHPVLVLASCPLSIPEVQVPQRARSGSQGNAPLSSLGAPENSLRCCEIVFFEPPGAQGPAGGIAGALTPLP